MTEKDKSKEYATLIIACSLGVFLVASAFSFYLDHFYVVDADTLQMLRANSLLAAGASFLFLRIQQERWTTLTVFGGFVTILLSGVF
jgi:hypothetical protein